MKILVTGGLGFIGHQVVSNLEAAGHTVIIVDKKTTYGGSVDVDELTFLYNERAKQIYTQDIFNYDIAEIQIKELFKEFQPEIVIHLASFPRQKVVEQHPKLACNTMSEGLVNLLEASKNSSVKKFVYISSSLVYGDFSDNVIEKTICQPRNQYGILKLAGEMLVRYYTRKFNLNHVIIRPSAVYGPLDLSDRVIPTFILNATRGDDIVINGENEKLDFTYVGDVARGIVDASLSDNATNRTYNITKGRSVLLKDAATIILNLVNSSSNIIIKNREVSMPSRGALSIDQAKNDFGYMPLIDFQIGAKLTVEYIFNNSFYFL